jgi:hypothetical protein
MGGLLLWSNTASPLGSWRTSSTGASSRTRGLPGRLTGQQELGAVPLTTLQAKGRKGRGSAPRSGPSRFQGARKLNLAI